MFVLTQSIYLSNYLLANFRGLVLGCIEANLGSWKALDAIYQIYIPLRLWSRSGKTMENHLVDPTGKRQENIEKATTIKRVETISDRR